MSNPSIVSLATTALKAPAALIDRAADREALAWCAPRLLAIGLGGTAIFGAVVGSYRGGIQLLYAAVKMPVLLLIPLVVGLPAVAALFHACDVKVSWPRLAMAGLAGYARTGVLAAAAGPVLWLLYSMHLDYHLSVLTLAGALALLGLPGLASMAAAARTGGARRWLATACSVMLLGVLVAQSGWLLRPFVARPTVDVAFLRPVEEDIVSSLMATGNSALGRYGGWEAEATGLMGRWQEERRAPEVMP